MIVTSLVFIAILGLLVFVHELGHFLAAKALGVRVEEFAFGFRPRLVSWVFRGTRYAINMIPLGGYVRLLGEDGAIEGEGKEETIASGSIELPVGGKEITVSGKIVRKVAPSPADAFFTQPIWRRFVILVAGSVMNVLLGWLILTVFFAKGMEASVTGFAANPFVDQTTYLVVGSTASGSPASTALLPGDWVLSINQQSVTTGVDFLEVVSANRGKNVSLEIRRGQEVRKVNLLARSSPPTGEGSLGLQFGVEGRIKTAIWKAPLAAVYATGQALTTSAQEFVKFLGQLVFRAQISDRVTGLIGIGEITGMARRLGIDYLAQMVAIISIGLAAINLMPIIPMDGGHLAVLLFEKLLRRRPSERQLAFFNSLGLGLIAVIFISVTYKDILRFDIIGRIFKH